MSDWGAFDEAFIHEPGGHRIMGRRVRPFSYYHLLILEVIDSPLYPLPRKRKDGAAEPRPPGVADLELAARICQCDFREAEKRLPRWQRWAKWSPGWWWRLFRCARGAGLKELAAWNAYIADYFTVPEIDSIGGQSVGRSKFESFPSVFSPVIALIFQTGWAPEKVWMLSCAEVQWYGVGLRWFSGKEGLRLVDEQGREIREGIQRMREAGVYPEINPADLAALRKRLAGPVPGKS